MENERTVLELEPSDLLNCTVKQIACTDCIKGHCPARTPSSYDGQEFNLCGAKEISQPVLAAYKQRTNSQLHIQRPS